MAPDATIRIRILGGIKSALEADSVARAIDNVKDKAETLALAAMYANDRMKKLNRTMLRMQATMAGLSFGFRRLSISMTATSLIAWSLASLALPALVIALYNVAAATLVVAAAFTAGLVGAFVAAGLMAVAVVGRFKQMSGVIGSAANELQNAGYTIRGAFRDATAKGADALMRGLARGLTKLAPLIRSLEGSFTAMGQAFGTMFEGLFTQLAGMGPELREMFRRLLPVIHSTGVMLGAMLRLFVQLASVGAPLVADAFDWLAKKMGGWTDSFTDSKVKGALGTIKLFAAGVKSFVNAFMEPLRGTFGPAMKDFSAAWKESGDDLGRLLGAIVAGFMEFGRDVLPMVTAAIRWLSGAVGDNGDRVAALLTGIVALSLALRAITTTFAIVKGAMAAWSVFTAVASAVMWSLNAAIVANPLGALLVAIVAVGVAFYEAYQNIKLFRDAVNEVASQVGLGPTAARNPTTTQRATQSGLRHGLESLPTVGPLFQGMFAGHAGGGTMTRGGMSWVGERGPELVNLPKASTVFTAAESRSIAGHDRPQASEPQSAPRERWLQPINFQVGARTLASVVEEIQLGNRVLEG